MVEAAIMTTLFLTLVFGMLDLSICLFRQQVLSEAARQGARAAIVHGYFAPNSSSMNAWGPSPSYYPSLGKRELYSGSTSYTVRADDPSDEFASVIRPYLVGLDPSTVTIRVQWPDGNNEPGNRVTVSAGLKYRRVINMISSGEDCTELAASSSLTIMH
jgi:hypothetical protein